MAEKHLQKYQVTKKQKRNAFYISLALVVLQAAAVGALMFLSTSAKDVNAAVFVIMSVNVISSAISAWLARKGRSVWGIQILLAVQILTVVFVLFFVGGTGFPIALFLFTLTFSITSETLPKWIGTRYNIAAGIVAGAAILLDIFEPFERVQVERSMVSWGIAGALTIIFSFFVIRQFRDYTLRTKLVVSFLFISIVTVMSFLAVANFNMGRALRQVTEQRLLSEAGMVGTSVDESLRYKLATAGVAASFPGIQRLVSASPEELENKPVRRNAQDLLFSTSVRDPMIISVAVLDANGINILDSHLNNVGNDESDRIYFQPAYRDRLRYVSPVLYLPGQEPSFFVSVPIQDDLSDTRGVLRIQYSADALQLLIVEHGGVAGQSSFSVLVDDEMVLQAHGMSPELIGHFVATPDAEKIAELRAAYRLPPDIPDDQLSLDLPDAAAGMKNISTNPIFTVSESPIGTPLTGAAARLHTNPWVVTSMQPQTVFLAPLHVMSRSLLLTALILVTVAGLLALGVAHIITTPILRLTDVANRFAQGDLIARAQVSTNDEIGALASTFNNMAAQLRGVLSTLEQRIAERTRALEVSTEVSRRLSTILDQDELVREVVEQVQSAFGYYHVHVYLFDREKKNLLMAGGTGEPGKIMLKRGHQLPKGMGLVGRAAETNLPILISDVSRSPGWLPNPLLPETKSETAIPIAIGGDVRGVLDVQHNTVGGLTDEDVTLLQSIANHIAIALKNAEAYQRTRQRAEREAVIARIAQQIQNTMEIEDALKIAARELGRALDTEISVKLQNTARREAHKE